LVGEPEVTGCAKTVTPSSQYTVAGRLVSVSIRLTVAPLTAAPVAELNTMP